MQSLNPQIIFSDILIIPHALGQKVSFVEGEGPLLDPLLNPSDCLELSTSNFLQTIDPVMQAITEVRRNLDSEKALIGFAGSPWTVACYMLEGRTSKTFSQAKVFALKYPQAFEGLLQVLVEATSQYLTRQVEAGAEVLQLFDSWAASVPEAYFEDWVVRPTQKIIENVKQQHPSIPIIGFPKGSGALYLPYVSGTGVDGISLDSALPLQWALDNLPADVVIQGALDPQVLVVGGDAMEQEVRRQKHLLAGRPHIFNLGHGIVPETPPRHVEDLLVMLRNDYGR